MNQSSHHLSQRCSLQTFVRPTPGTPPTLTEQQKAQLKGHNSVSMSRPVLKVRTR